MMNSSIAVMLIVAIALVALAGAAPPPNTCNKLACDLTTNVCTDGFCCGGVCVTPQANLSNDASCPSNSPFSAEACGGTCMIGPCDFDTCLRTTTTGDEGCPCSSPSTCGHAMTCSSGVCRYTKDVGYSPTGDYCLGNEECGSNTCNDGQCGALAPVAPGSSCNGFTPCQAGSYCQLADGLGTCAVRVPLGAPCTEANVGITSIPSIPTCELLNGGDGYNPCLQGACANNGTGHFCIDVTEAGLAMCPPGYAGATQSVFQPCVAQCAQTAGATCYTDRFMCATGFLCKATNLLDPTQTAGTCVTPTQLQTALQATYNTVALGGMCSYTPQCQGLAFCNVTKEAALSGSSKVGICQMLPNNQCGPAAPSTVNADRSTMCNTGSCECQAAPSNEFQCDSTPAPAPPCLVENAAFDVADYYFNTNSSISGTSRSYWYWERIRTSDYAFLTPALYKAFVDQQCCKYCGAGGLNPIIGANEGLILDCVARTISRQLHCGGPIAATITCATGTTGYSTTASTAGTATATAGPTASTTDAATTTATTASAATISASPAWVSLGLVAATAVALNLIA